MTYYKAKRYNNDLIIIFTNNWVVAFYDKKGKLLQVFDDDFDTNENINYFSEIENTKLIDECLKEYDLDTDVLDYFIECKNAEAIAGYINNDNCSNGDIDFIATQCKTKLINLVIKYLRSYDKVIEDIEEVTERLLENSEE